MNYPIWDLPASGLLIAAVAILHVFISHFAVGGGLFLVLAERKARREGDAALLAYVKKHSRFFILLTLVLGAITGVGIWFTITLVHPAATSALINIFVWGWAIEWTFFVTEIAAAMVYYYGWDRLSARTHMAVGWVYFVSAWLSLVIINGILSFMLTPGDWLTTRGFWDGFFNPTYWSSMVARTFAAVGLAGIYALFTAASLDDEPLKEKIARWAGLRWVVPMAIALPISLVWYLAAAAGAGAPVTETFGSASARTTDLLAALFSGATATGYPFAQTALRVALLGAAFTLFAVLFLALARSRAYGRVLTGAILLAGFAVIGGGEWAREDLRKPYVIGSHMLVNGIRLPAAPGAPPPPAGFEDRFTLDALDRTGVLPASLYARIPEDWTAEAGGPGEDAAGRELFRIECSACHTVDAYNAVRPLVAGQSSATLEGLLGRLAKPVAASGEETTWDDPENRLETWRGRRMPPFVGTAAEKRALAVYLAGLGGGEIAPPPSGAPDGAALFDAGCAMCHDASGDWPIAQMIRGRDAEGLYDALGRLSELNDMMPDFEGTEEERRALADWLAAVEGGAR